MHKWLLFALLLGVILSPGGNTAFASDNSCRLIIQLRPGVKFDSENWKSFRVLSTSVLNEKAALPAIGENTGILRMTDNTPQGYEMFWRGDADGPGMHLDRPHFQKAYGTSYPSCENLHQLSTQFGPRFKQSELALKIVGGEKALGFSWGHFFLSLEASMYFRYGYWVDSVELIKKYDQDLEFFRQQLKHAPGDFLQKLNFLTTRIFEHQYFTNYCKTSNSQTSSYLYKCTACQGQTLITLAILKDLNVEIPAPYTLGFQVFTDHIRPVLWDSSQKHLLDLVYGGQWEDSLDEAVYRPEALLEHLLSGPDTGLSAEQVSALPEPKFGCYVIASPDPKIAYNFLRCQNWSKSLFIAKRAKPSFQKNANFIGLIDEAGSRFKTHIKFPLGGELDAGRLSRNDFQSTARHVGPRAETSNAGDSSEYQIAVVETFTKILYPHLDAFEGDVKERLIQLASLVNDWGVDLDLGIKDLRKSSFTGEKTYSIKKVFPPSDVSRPVFVQPEFFEKIKPISEDFKLSRFIDAAGDDRKASGYNGNLRFVPVVEFSELPDIAARESYKLKWTSLSLTERLGIYESLRYQQWEMMFSTSQYQSLYKFLTTSPEQMHLTADEIQSLNDWLQQLIDRYKDLMEIKARLRGVVHVRGSLIKGMGLSANAYVDSHIRDFERLVVHHANLLSHHHRTYLDAAATWSESDTGALQTFYNLLGSVNQTFLKEVPSEAGAMIWPEWSEQFGRYAAIASYPEYLLLDSMLNDPDYTYTAKKTNEDLQQLAKQASFTVLERWTPAVDVQLPQAGPKDFCRNRSSGIYGSVGLVVECAPSSQVPNDQKIVLRKLKTLPALFLKSIFENQPQEYLLYPPTQLLMALSWSDELDQVTKSQTVKDMVFFPSAFLLPRSDGEYASTEYRVNYISAEYLLSQNLPSRLNDRPDQFWHRNALWNAGYLAWREQVARYNSKGQYVGNRMELGYGLVRNQTFGASIQKIEAMHLDSKFYLFIKNEEDDDIQTELVPVPQPTPYKKAFNTYPK